MQLLVTQGISCVHCSVPPSVISGNTIVQHYNQETDNYAVKIQDLFIATRIIQVALLQPHPLPFCP